MFLFFWCNLPAVLSLALLRTVQQLVELLVPAIVMALIGLIKEALTVNVFPEHVPLTDSPVVTYDIMQDTAVYPNVLCYDNNMFLRYCIG